MTTGPKRPNGGRDYYTSYQPGSMSPGTNPTCPHCGRGFVQAKIVRQGGKHVAVCPHCGREL
jgi:uncharacterized protein (DUF983 family)